MAFELSKFKLLFTMISCLMFFAHVDDCVPSA